jgi:hypothetical protein
MRKPLLLPLAALALLGLAACGQKAKNEAAEATEAVGGDSNTMGEAVSDVNAAFANAEDSYDGNLAGADTSIPDGNEIVE